jgi:hypothetical protein
MFSDTAIFTPPGLDGCCSPLERCLLLTIGAKHDRASPMTQLLHLLMLASTTEISSTSGVVGVQMYSEDRPDYDAYTQLIHPSVAHFIRCLSDLKNLHVVLSADMTKRPRSLTTKALHALYCEHAPEAPLSQSQCYRLDRGEAAPTIVEVYEFASIFNVSPQIFLPATARSSAVHARLKQRYSQPPQDH